MTFVHAVTEKGQVTIPLLIREALGLKPRAKVVFFKHKDRVYLKPAVSFLDLAGSIKTNKPFDIPAMRKAAQKMISQRHG